MGNRLLIIDSINLPNIIRQPGHQLLSCTFPAPPATVFTTDHALQGATNAATAPARLEGRVHQAGPALLHRQHQLLHLVGAPAHAVSLSCRRVTRRLPRFPTCSPPSTNVQPMPPPSFALLWRDSLAITAWVSGPSQKRWAGVPMVEGAASPLFVVCDLCPRCRCHCRV